MHFTEPPPAEILAHRELAAGFAVLLVVVLKWITELCLETLNQRHLARAAPASSSGGFETAAENRDRSSSYTLAKSHLHQVDATVEMVVLLLLLTSGLLPWLYRMFAAHWGVSIASEAGFVLCVLGLATLPGLPLSWYLHFNLEQRFGFNTLTPALWWMDRLKGTLLAAVLSYPMLLVILKMARWAGPDWWFYAWAAVLIFQLLIVLLAPVLILPLFNRFEPLPQGSLKNRLLALAEKAGFHTRGIQVMDGSKRSRHSNAFFTGFGRFRRIVLYDTLISQLNESELEAVLAHEIGHYKKFHVAKTLCAFAGGLLVAFFLLARCAQYPWFLQAFRLPAGNVAAALLLFALLAGTLTFWFSPLFNYLSRRFEFQADDYAAEIMGGPGSLLGALRKLEEKNLADPAPHPLYSRVYYSHPTLAERERVLLRPSGSTGGRAGVA